MMKLTARHYIWFSLGIIIIAIVAVSLFYRSIQQDLWNEKSQAQRIAIQDTEMVLATDVQVFHAEESYYVVHGEDESANEMMVWIQEEEVIRQIHTDEGISKEKIIEQVLQNHADANIIRVTPGIQKDAIIWEVYYRLKTDSGTRSYYDYYHFADGSHIDTYTLSLGKN